MSELTEKIREVIAANLPAQTASELKKYLDEAEKTAEALKASEEQIKSLDVIVKRLTKEFNEASDELEKHADLDKRKLMLDEREKALDKRDREFELELVRAELTSAGRERDVAIRLVQTIFQGPVFKRVVRETGDVPLSVPGLNPNMDQYGNPVVGQILPGVSSGRVDKTTETEETGGE